MHTGMAFCRVIGLALLRNEIFLCIAEQNILITITPAVFRLTFAEKVQLDLQLVREIQLPNEILHVSQLAPPPRLSASSRAAAVLYMYIRLSGSFWDKGFSFFRKQVHFDNGGILRAGAISSV